MSLERAPVAQWSEGVKQLVAWGCPEDKAQCLVKTVLEYGAASYAPRDESGYLTEGFGFVREGEDYYAEHVVWD